MDADPIMDLKSLEADLRMAAAYASRVGVLGDLKVLQSLDAVEQQRRAQGQADAHSLTLALNQAAQAIQPMTLADLRSGRDPFDPRNQRRARGLQLCLAVAALLTMLMIGHSMQSLRIEKAGLKAMEQLQAMQPAQKSTALRKIAQLDDPLARQSSAADLYRQKMAEWVAMFQTRQLLDTQIYEARNTSMFPWDGLAQSVSSWFEQATGARVSAEEVAAASSTPRRTPDGGAPVVQPAQDDAIDFCRRDEKSGAIVLPAADAARPEWMKNLIADFLEDFCFRDEVLKPITGDSYAATQDVGRGGFIPKIESKVSMRSDWFLPFWFGCLGAIIFVMRNVASIRTPAMELFPMVMRISLGGVAGIVIGWFSTAALPALESTGALSVPFALAFLTGYGIDALFGVLDRMSRIPLSGSATAPPKA